MTARRPLVVVAGTVQEMPAGDVSSIEKFAANYTNCSGLRVVGAGAAATGFEIPVNITINEITWRVETDSSGGTTTGQLYTGADATVAAALSGTNANPTKATPGALTGLSINVNAGVIVYPWCTAIGTGTIGRGLSVMIRGVLR